MKVISLKLDQKSGGGGELLIFKSQIWWYGTLNGTIWKPHSLAKSFEAQNLFCPHTLIIYLFRATVSQKKYYLPNLMVTTLTTIISQRKKMSIGNYILFLFFDQVINTHSTKKVQNWIPLYSHHSATQYSRNNYWYQFLVSGHRLSEPMWTKEGVHMGLTAAAAMGYQLHKGESLK